MVRATDGVSIAANTSSGLNQWPHTGGSEMYFHPAFAARNAVTAVELGGAGRLRLGEHPGGRGRAVRGVPPPAAPRDRSPCSRTGSRRSSSVYNKPVPACNFAQTPCQAALRVADAAGRRIVANARSHPGARAGSGDALSGLRLRRAVPARAAGQDEHPVRRGRSAAAQAHRRGELPAPRRRRASCASSSLTALEEDQAFTQRFPATPGRRGARQPCRWLARSWTGWTMWSPATSDEVRAPLPGCGRSGARAARAPPRSRIVAIE